MQTFCTVLPLLHYYLPSLKHTARQHKLPLCQKSLLADSKPSPAEQSTFIDEFDESAAPHGSAPESERSDPTFFFFCDDSLHNALHNVCMGWQSAISCDTWRVSQVDQKVCHCYCAFALETHTFIKKKKNNIKKLLYCAAVCVRGGRKQSLHSSAVFEPHKNTWLVSRHVFVPSVHSMDWESLKMHA